jgi:hypothetical protein
MDVVIASGDDVLLQGVLRGEIALQAAARYLKNEGKSPRLPPPVKNCKVVGGPVFTTVLGDNADLIGNVARLYLRPGDVVRDVTIGQSVFWKKVDLSAYDFTGTDIALEPSVDLRHLPDADGTVDHLVLDPPHQHDASLPITGARYNARRTVGTMSHDDIINDLYGGGLAEAWRVLKAGGLCWVKCCDEIAAGRQRWSHIEILEIAKRIGFEAMDLFILHRAADPMLRHAHQLHARKNHSFLWIFKKTAARTVRAVDLRQKSTAMSEAEPENSNE